MTVNGNETDETEIIRMSDYSYNLKESSIARYPASPRGSSKLLRVNGLGEVTYYDNFSNVFASLAKDSHLIFNDSRVLDARLYCLDSSQKRIELMILDLGNVDMDAPCNTITLRAMMRTHCLKEGDVFTEAMTRTDQIQVVEVHGVWLEDDKSDGNGMECSVRIISDESVDRYLHTAGSVPIPPYFVREAEKSDKDAYNNVYAAADGSVAAPTAGLHFTHDLLSQIDTVSFLTLHVGAGTFQPVLLEDASEHKMHAEFFSVSVKELQRIICSLQQNKPLIVVGTTSCRTLESLYWCGVKMLVIEDGVDVCNLELHQFEWKSLERSAAHVSRVQALEALLHEHATPVISGRTSLMITPNSYDFKVVDHLLTNFHAPDSTLMLLVAAFLKSGEKIKSIYEEAQTWGYRFLSYGDVCMFSRPDCTELDDVTDRAS